jgi:hypothetical protein
MFINQPWYHNYKDIIGTKGVAITIKYTSNSIFCLL